MKQSLFIPNSFKSCESVVFHIILLNVARKFSGFCKMARRSNLVGPRCLRLMRGGHRCRRCPGYCLRFICFSNL